jgi:hypothetical protein
VVQERDEIGDIVLGCSMGASPLTGMSANTTFGITPTAGDVAGHKLDLPIAGDERGRQGQVARLARGGGLNAFDVGPLKRARELAAARPRHMGVQNALESGFGSALKIVAPDGAHRWPPHEPLWESASVVADCVVALPKIRVCARDSHGRDERVQGRR